MSGSVRRPKVLAALLLAGAASRAEAGRAIVLHGRTIDTAAVPRLAAPAGPVAPSGLRYYVVQRDTRVDDAWRARLAAAGAVEIAYLPEDALLVGAPDGAFPRIAALGSWVGRLAATDKLSRDLASMPPPSSGERVGLHVQVMPVEPLDAMTDALDALVPGASARVVKATGRFPRLAVFVPWRDVLATSDAIARLEGVAFVEPGGEIRFFNQAGRWVGQNWASGGTTGDLTPIFTRGITGKGQIVGIGDDGFDYEHACFHDATQPVPGPVRNGLHRKIVSLYKHDPAQPGKYTSGHGTHTAGSVACDSNGSGTWDCNNGTCADGTALANAADGMAPGAKLAMSWLGTTDPPGVPPDLNAVFEEAYRDGARVHTNSWGSCGSCSSYTSHSQDLDEFAWEHPDMTILFANGNAGPGSGTVGPPATAKNAISVGAANRSTSANGLASFSSRGPTDDLRRKPTLTATGVNVQSALASNAGPPHSGSTSLSGTSMACPTAAGYATLARAYLRDGFYPTGVKDPANALPTPSAAAVKALLLASCRNMTGPAAIPSNEQGFGRVNLVDALYFPGASRKLFVDDHRGLGAASTPVTYAFTITDSSVPLKVVLCWTDAPPAIMAGTKLVNDLDLTVTGPGGSPVYVGSVFSGGVSTTGGSYDRLNVEEVVLTPATPALGTWTVTVTAANVPRSPQPFALVATGGFTPPLALGLHAVAHADGGNNVPEAGETVAMTPTLRDLSGAGATAVTATLSTATPGVSVLTGGPVPYGNLVAGGTSSPVAPFSYAIGSGVPCGSVIAFSLAVTTATGSVTVPFGVRVGRVSVDETTLLADAFAGTAGASPSAASWTTGLEVGATGWTKRVVLDDTIEIVGTSPGPRSAPTACYIGVSGSGAGRARPYLQTLPLSFAGMDRGHVDFHYWISKSTSTDFLILKASTDGGGTWRELWRNIQHDSPYSLDMNELAPTRVWQKVVVDLAGTGIPGSASVLFRFVGDFAAVEATRSCYVEDVAILGGTTACDHPPVTLYVAKVGGKARLTWTAGTSPYLVTRADNVRGTDGVEAAEPWPALTFDDDVLLDEHEHAWNVN